MNAVEGSAEPLRLFLHIGVHKTGSTSLQLRYSGNPDVLKRHGTLYPLGRFPRYPHQHSELMHLAVPQRLDELNRVLRDIRSEAVASACHTVLLSGEDLSLTPEPGLKRLHDAMRSAGFDPVAVGFFRPYVDQVRSLASEHMKMRGPFITPSRLASLVSRFDEAEVTTRFASVFGSANVIWHQLENGQSCVELFDKDVGLTLDLPAPWLNTRIDFATLSWLNAIKDELDLPLAVPQRLYAKHFQGSPAISAAEAAFLTEVAKALTPPKGDRLNDQVRQLRADAGSAVPMDVRLDYLDRLSRFIADLNRYARRRARRKALRQWLLRRFRSEAQPPVARESKTGRRT